MTTVLTIYDTYTPGMTIAAEHAALDIGPNPAEVVLSQDDVDALPDPGGILALLLIKDYVRLLIYDNATRDDLKAGAINSITGERVQILRDEKIIIQADGVARATAFLQQLIQGSFQINFAVRTTTEDWKENQQFKLRIPAKDITFMMTITSAPGDYVGTLSDGRDEVLFRCTAQLTLLDPLDKFLRAIRAQNTPETQRKIRYEPA